MKPLAIPMLTPEQFKHLEEEMNKPPTKEQKAQARQALDVYYTIERNTCLKCAGKEVKCPKGHLRCDQYFLSPNQERQMKI